MMAAISLACMIFGSLLHTATTLAMVSMYDIGNDCVRGLQAVGRRSARVSQVPAAAARGRRRGSIAGLSPRDRGVAGESRDGGAAASGWARAHMMRRPIAVSCKADCVAASAATSPAAAIFD